MSERQVDGVSEVIKVPLSEGELAMLDKFVKTLKGYL